MIQTKPVIYLGCALSNSTQQFKESVEFLRKSLTQHAKVLGFLGLTHPNISEVFQWDTNCVRRCDILVADITYASIGLGVELGIALEHRKPIITIADDTAALQRQIMYGYLDPLHFTYRYKTREDAAKIVMNKIKEFLPTSYAK